MPKARKTAQQSISERFAALDDIDKQILTHLLTYPAITDREIGHLLGLSREAINHRRRKESFKRAHHEYLMKPLDVIAASLDKAVRVLVKSLDSKNEKLRFDAACRLLQSEGVLKREIDQGTVNLTANFAVINRVNGDKTILEAKFTPGETTGDKSSIE